MQRFILNVEKGKNNNEYCVKDFYLADITGKTLDKTDEENSSWTNEKGEYIYEKKYIVQDIDNNDLVVRVLLNKNKIIHKLIIKCEM